MKTSETKEVATRKLEVFYKNMKTNDGKKFKKWLTATFDGKIYQVAFVLLAKNNMPKARSFVYVKDTDMNWKRENPQYPVLYIKEIQKVEPIETPPEDFDKYFEKA